jgi:ribonuclease PH
MAYNPLMTNLYERPDGRFPHQLRPITFELNYTRWAEGSVLVKFGHTHVLCNATLDDRLPNWLRYSDASHGWVTAEYALLPRSTHSRVGRETRWPKGRTQEISRLIGRSLRMAVDLEALGQRQIIVDCDVLQADGGTRTAAITGGWVALQLALKPLIAAGDVPPEVMGHQVAAVSVGIVADQLLLDLPYAEDAAAAVDLNVVMTGSGQLIEIQGTAEKAPFTVAQHHDLLALAVGGIEQLIELQRHAVNGR